MMTCCLLVRRAGTTITPQDPGCRSLWERLYDELVALGGFGKRGAPLKQLLKGARSNTAGKKGAKASVAAAAEPAQGDVPGYAFVVSGSVTVSDVTGGTPASIGTMQFVPLFVPNTTSTIPPSASRRRFTPNTFRIRLGGAD
jgi:hypothetical protein